MLKIKNMFKDSTKFSEKSSTQDFKIRFEYIFIIN